MILHKLILRSKSTLYAATYAKIRLINLAKLGYLSIVLKRLKIVTPVKDKTD